MKKHLLLVGVITTVLTTTGAHTVTKCVKLTSSTTCSNSSAAHRPILTYFLFKNYFNLYIYLYIFSKFLIFTQLHTILTPKTHQKSLKTRRNPPFFCIFTVRIGHKTRFFRPPTMTKNGHTDNQNHRNT